MQFTYNAYKKLISCLKNHDYAISSYKDWNDTQKCAILRHDIDNDIKKSTRFCINRERIRSHEHIFCYRYI